MLHQRASIPDWHLIANDTYATHMLYLGSEAVCISTQQVCTHKHDELGTLWELPLLQWVTVCMQAFS